MANSNVSKVVLTSRRSSPSILWLPFWQRPPLFLERRLFSLSSVGEYFFNVVQLLSVVKLGEFAEVFDEVDVPLASFHQSLFEFYCDNDCDEVFLRPVAVAGCAQKLEQCVCGVAHLQFDVHDVLPCGGEGVDHSPQFRRSRLVVSVGLTLFLERVYPAMNSSGDFGGEHRWTETIERRQCHVQYLRPDDAGDADVDLARRYRFGARDGDR